jgi:hypothetical protein
MALEAVDNDITHVKCPCNEFGNVESIRKALDSDERTKALVAWLAAENSEGKQLSCQSLANIACTRRVGASFLILNEIRNAVRPFLETVKPEKQAEPTYEESFPSLAPTASTTTTPNVATVKPKKKLSPVTISTATTMTIKKQGPGKKEKRRIRLEPVAQTNAKGGNIDMLSSSSSSSSSVPMLQRESNGAQANDWPAMTVKKKSNGKSKPKRRITPTPATAWGSAAPGNIASLSSDPMTMSPPTSADFDNVKQQQVSPWSVKRQDDKKLGPTAIQQVPAAFGGDGKPALGNIATLSSESIMMPTPTKADFDNVKKTGSWPVKKPEQNKPELTTIQPVPANTITSYAAAQSETSEINTMEQRQNLATVYSTLILNHLVPSTVLELHLLVRLLTAKEASASSSTPAKGENAAPFRSIFATASCCHSFAIDVLTRVKRVLCNLPLDIVEGFVNCPQFASQLPDLTKELNDVVLRRKEMALLPEVKAISIVGNAHPQMPLLTLPFHHERDSRHNYRSRDELAIYKNREESRDAFLYQLRAFQYIRGKVVDATQAERSIDRIRTASKSVMQGLLKSNMFWFAQLFCDLLVQIGLVPMEETDKELLNIADKDKLQVRSNAYCFPCVALYYILTPVDSQKLHKRFSAKGAQTSKSSKTLVLDPSKSAGTASPVVEAQQYFPGHQEFFFIFILSTDCYSFGVHLKNRLKCEMLKLLSLSDIAKGVEKRLLQLKLLSRFLGLLVFSPSWHESGFGGGSHYDKLSEFNPELDVITMVERAYKERHLVTTVPWVVELLRMTRWSPTVQKSDEFKRLLALLLGIRHRIQCSQNTASDNLGANMQLVSLYLETLFGDIIGLERAETIPPQSITESTVVPVCNGKTKPVDEFPMRLSMSVLFTSNPHAEELVALLSSQAQSQTKSAGSTRKLTPYSIGGSIGSSTDILGTQSSASFSPVNANRRVSLGNGTFESAQVEGTFQDSPIVGKLVEAFFHQHRNLKGICEFIVDQTLKNVASRMRDEFVVPLLEQKVLDVVDRDSSTDNAEVDVIEASRTFLAAELATAIPQALTILCPPLIQPKVRDVAAQLSVSHATRLGETTIDSLVRLESKKLSLENARKSKKQASASSETKESGKVETNQQDAAGLEDALVSLRTALSNRMWERRPENMKSVIETARERLSSSQSGDVTTLRGLKRAFELGAIPLLVWSLGGDSRDSSVRWTIATHFLRVVTLIFANSKTSSSWECTKKNIASFFSDQEAIDTFIELCVNGDIETTAQVIVDLTRAKLIPISILEVALLWSLHSHGQGRVLCQQVVSRYCDDAKSNAFDRLRNELSTDNTE